MESGLDRSTPRHLDQEYIESDLHRRLGSGLIWRWYRGISWQTPRRLEVLLVIRASNSLPRSLRRRKSSSNGELSSRFADMNLDGLIDVVATGPNGIYISYDVRRIGLNAAPAYEVAQVLGHTAVADSTAMHPGYRGYRGSEYRVEALATGRHVQAIFCIAQRRNRLSIPRQSRGLIM